MTTDTLTREDTGSFAPVRLAHRPAVAPVSSGNPLAGWVPPSSWADEPTPLYDPVYAAEQPIPEEHALAQTEAARSLVGYEDARHRWASERDLVAWCEQIQASWVPAVEQHRPRSVSELFNEEQYRRLRDNPQLLPAPEVLLAGLPPDPARELTPEALDAEHQQRQTEQQPVIHVDFNAQARGGQIKASIRQASRPIEIGQTVRAVDPHEDDMAYDAVVRSIEGACVYLEPLLNSHAGLAALSQRRGVDYADDPAPEPEPEPRHLLRAELRALRDDLRRAWTELRAWRPWKRGER